MIGIIIDVVVVAIMLLGFFVGLKKGFIKQLRGILRGLVPFVGSIVLTALIVNALQPVDFYQQFAAVAGSWFGDEVLAKTVSTQAEIESVLADGGAWKALTVLSATFERDLATFQSTTLSELFGHYTANIITSFVLWLILFIILKIIFKQITKLLRKLSRLPVFNVLDKVFGALWGLVLTYVIVISLLLTGAEIVVYQFFNDKWQTVADFIAQSQVLTFASNTNIIGNLLSGLIINTQLPQITVTPAA